MYFVQEKFVVYKSQKRQEDGCTGRVVKGGCWILSVPSALSLYIYALREREREHKQGRGRERGRYRI